MPKQLGFDFKYTHKDHTGKILYNSDWLPNQVADDGFEQIFDVFFRGATNPASFKIGLTTTDPNRTDSYGDLDQVSGIGYSEASLTRDVTGFPYLQETEGDIEIRTREVEFENASVNTGDPADAWDTATNAYIASVIGGSSTFIAWRALSASRTLMPGDVLTVTVRQKGLMPTE